MFPRHAGLAAGLILGLTAALTAAPVAAEVETPRLVTADVETQPVSHSGDAADDPALWVHPTDPALSLLIGNDKRGALEVYNLDGTLRQRIVTATAFWGNVDVRQGVQVGSQTRDIVVSYNGGLRVYTVNPATRMLQLVTDGTGVIGTGGGEGLCLYDSATTGDVSANVITRAGRLRQYELTDPDGDGLVQGSLTRELQVGSESEGCVADDATGALYVSEEDVGLWRYGAEPGAGSARSSLDTVQPSGHLAADVEGVTLVDLGGTDGYIIASAQNVAAAQQNYYVVYDRATNAYVESVKVVNGATADGCQRTDGITAYAGDLGPSFPQGAFVCQDNSNTAPGSSGNQSFKLVRLEKVVDLGGPVEPGITFVGASGVHRNSARHSVQIPAAVRPGDALTLFFTGNRSAVTVGGPAGWSSREAVVGDGIVGRLWTRTAVAGDAGSTVAVTLSATTKGALTVAAYRGTASDPVEVSGAGLETTSRAAHTTPVVTVPQDGGRLVSYWADKSAATTAFTVPADHDLRSAVSGSSTGHITAALADRGPVQAGSVGGSTAVATSASPRAVMFSVVLGPAG